jgi:hypothetical protein
LFFAKNNNQTVLTSAELNQTAWGWLAVEQENPALDCAPDASFCAKTAGKPEIEHRAAPKYLEAQALLRGDV